MAHPIPDRCGAGRRRLWGLGLVAHGLAHAWPGTAIIAAGTTWLAQTGPGGAMGVRWLAALLQAAAMAGFAGAGAGLLGAPGLRRVLRPVVGAAAVASIALLLLFRWLPLTLPGLLVDALVLWTVAETPMAPRARPGRVRAVAGAAVMALVAWLALVTATAPWHRFHGTTPAELAAALPGDAPLEGAPTYWIQHATTVAAPAAAVWPWLAQLGTDRGGFYSVEWLENVFGVPVRNADRIHGEWQGIEPGGFVMATPPGWLGIDHPLGWKVGHVEPGRVLVLENWGAFVLVPVGETMTRLIVRTRDDAVVSPVGFALAWLGLITFEPAHFIMERAMLRGIRKRAETVY